MAESDAQINQTEQEVKGEVEKLQYLEIVHLAAIRAVLCVTTLYLYAKENSGPLRNGVESVEGTVKTVVGPLYDRYHGFPFELLKIADRKVGASVQELERHVPEGVKKAPDMARSVVGEVQRAGVVATAAGLAKAACFRAEPAAERLAASAWRSLNRLPVFPQVASAVVPAAAGLSERYNRAVSCAAEKGYAVSAYLPLVPTERIAKVEEKAFAKGGLGRRLFFILRGADTLVAECRGACVHRTK
ncbi:Stress-related protein [Dendrobium catenatum]|uniref:Stress-related protein n=1 Tax=Dendrobium catenatum TaxID=906689 RepID=A0A2I0XFQ7_9ASPA|nr:Stress-related protein [Dendrobium catenatum]